MLVVEQYVKRAIALATSAYVLDRGSVKFDGSTSKLQSSSIFSSYLGNA